MTEPTEDEILMSAKRLAHDDGRLWDAEDLEEAPAAPDYSLTAAANACRHRPRSSCQQNRSIFAVPARRRREMACPILRSIRDREEILWHCHGN